MVLASWTAKISLKASTKMQTAFFVMIWISLLVGHGYLTYPAMICRGAPPLPPEHYTALFITPLFVWLSSLFADRTMRSVGVAYGAVGFTILYAIAKTNLESACPHIGYTHGVLGIIESQWLMVAINTAVLYLPTVIAFYFLERVAELSEQLSLVRAEALHLLGRKP